MLSLFWSVTKVPTFLFKFDASDDFCYDMFYEDANPVAHNTYGCVKRAELKPLTPVVSLTTPMKNSVPMNLLPQLAKEISLISWSTFESPGCSIRKKLNSKDMAAADNDYPRIKILS